MSFDQSSFSVRSIMLALVAATVLSPVSVIPRAQKVERAPGLELPQQRGVDLKVGGGKTVKLYDKSYALIIGVSDYTNGWQRLPGVKQDIAIVRPALEKHGFQTVVVMNPTYAQLEEAYRGFIQQYGFGVENRLLFYFAGHGHTVRQSYNEDMGYIVPVDAPLPERDPQGFANRAMDMQQMEIYARRIQSKHALFLFDSCFSGAFFSLSRSIPDNISYKTSLPVRQFITSGSADERVPDRSVFREQFIAALEGEADLNRDSYVTGSELADFLQDRVVNYSRNAQHPQYGKIRNPYLDKGDFVFSLPRATTPPPPPVAAVPNNKPKGAPLAAPTPVRVDPAQQELAFWNSIQKSASLEDFKDYLTRYPNGLYSGIARRRVTELGNPAKPAPPVVSVTPTPLAGGTRPPANAPKPVLTPQGIELLWIPPGSFTMGSENGNSNEKPAHQVTIREGFYMGRYEVTQAQWRALMGSNPSYFKGHGIPVERVSWDDAVMFIARLNAQSDGYTYRLPTEAEWEYAARAGTTGDYAGELDAMAWYVINSGTQTRPVGLKLPNAFGLHDMHGNVWEWCADSYHDNYRGAPVDGSAWSSVGKPKYRVVRGGSWYDSASLCRSSSRDWVAPDSRGFSIGIRLVASQRQ